MKWSLIVLLFFITGCGGRIRPDPFPFSIPSNYPSAEFRACGEVWNGLGNCTVQKGEDYDKVQFKIQGYYEGTVRISSLMCAIDETILYKDHQLISVKILGTVTKSCVISFVISPIFPKEEKMPFKIGSYEGHLHIKMLKTSQSWYGLVTKLPENGYKKEYIPLISDTARIVFRGCGSTYDEQHTVRNGLAEVEIGEVVLDRSKEICVLHGKADEKRLTWLLAFFDPTFVRIPKPLVYFSKGEVRIEADKHVSVVSLDGEYKIKNSGKFKADSKKTHILRALTTGGRSILAVWDPKEQRWNWKR